MWENLKYKLQEKWIDFLGNPLFENIRIKYDAMPRRDQKAVKILLIFVLAFTVFYFFYSTLSSISERERDIKEAVLIIQNLDDLNKYIADNDDLIRSRRRTPTARFVSLFNLIEEQEKQSGISPEARVEIKEKPRTEARDGGDLENRASAQYKKITLRQLKDLLVGIESSEITAKVSSLSVKRNEDDKRYLDIEFELTSRMEE